MAYYLGQGRYCRVCGEEKLDEWQGAYYSKTGEKMYAKICPVDPCGHDGHRWKDIENMPKGFRLWLSLILRRHNEMCARCGATRFAPYCESGW